MDTGLVWCVCMPGSVVFRSIIGLCIPGYLLSFLDALYHGFITHARNMCERGPQKFELGGSNDAPA